MDAYSQLKPLFHVERLEMLRKGVQPPPVHVHLILSDLCNQDCHFCAYRMSNGLSQENFPENGLKNPNRKIPTDKAWEIIEDCAEIGVKAIQFTGGGEPTVHPDFEELATLAQDKGMKTALVTNGVKLSASWPVINMEWIRVSIDAGTPETYSQVRRVSRSHWDKVWKNISTLCDYDGRLGVGFVVTPDNYHELPQLIDQCLEYGVDNVRIGAVFSKAGTKYYGGLFDDIAGFIAGTKETYKNDKIDVIDLFGRRMSDLEGQSPEHPFCGYQYLTMYIGGDLKVYRCCNTAYTRQGEVGDLSERRLYDFHMARVAKLNYEPFDARTCQYCQFRGQNDLINAVITEPEHSEFV